MSGRLFDLQFYYEAMEIRRIGSRAVREVQEENRQLGIPNVYCLHGLLYYEHPDGKLALSDPLNSKP